MSDTELDPIDRPDIDITSGGESGAVAFDAVVLVRPTVGIPGYQGLVVTIPTLDVTDEEVDEQLDRLRATSGELVEVARPPRDRDQVTIDVHGTRSGMTGDDASRDLDATDFLYEVGSGGVVAELDEHLRGARPGDIFRFTSSLEPEGESVSFQVLGQPQQPGAGARPSSGSTARSYPAIFRCPFDDPKLAWNERRRRARRSGQVPRQAPGRPVRGPRLWPGQGAG